MHEVMSGYFVDWRPANTTICINHLRSSSAQVEIDMIAASPLNS